MWSEKQSLVALFMLIMFFLNLIIKVCSLSNTWWVWLVLHYEATKALPQGLNIVNVIWERSNNDRILWYLSCIGNDSPWCLPQQIVKPAAYSNAELNFIGVEECGDFLSCVTVLAIETSAMTGQWFYFCLVCAFVFLLN